MFPKLLDENFLCLVIGVMCPVCVTVVFWNNRWVTPIDVVHIVSAVVLHVGTFVRLLPHTLAWNYQLYVYVNTTLV